MDRPEGNIIGMLATHLAYLSLMAVGGGVVILAPDIQHYVVDVNHWLSNETFLAAYTIAQVSPGPNLLFVSLVGWYAAGLLGALTATAAIVLPPAVLTLLAVRLSGGQLSKRIETLIKASVMPISVGLLVATGYSLAKTADRSPACTLLTLVTVIAASYRRLNPVGLIAVGAAAGLLGWV